MSQKYYLAAVSVVCVCPLLRILKQQIRAFGQRITITNKHKKIQLDKLAKARLAWKQTLKQTETLQKSTDFTGKDLLYNSVRKNTWRQCQDMQKVQQANNNPEEHQLNCQ